MKFIWVVNSLRLLNQSAAQGLLISSALSLKKDFAGSEHVLLVTNEKHQFSIGSVSEAEKIIWYWINRCGLPVKTSSEVFSSILLFDRLGDPLLGDALVDRLTGSKGVVSSRGAEVIFLFNNSYFSESVFSRVVGKNCLTVFLSMAPMREYDSRADVITHSQVEAVIRVSSAERRKYLIPSRYPYFFGFDNAKASVFRSREAGVTVCTSGENILARLRAVDFLEVIFPTLKEYAQSRWIIVGVSEEVVRQFLETCAFGDVFRQLVSARRIILLGRIENFFEFLGSHVDVFYKGSHAGGGTTVAGAITKGIPVVDYAYGDCRGYLRADVLAHDASDARTKISKLIASDEFSKQFAAKQRRMLEENNNGGWSRELRSIIKEHFYGSGGFDPHYPRDLFNV